MIEQQVSHQSDLRQSSDTRFDASSFRGVSGVDALEKFPGFKRLIDNVVLPDLEAHPNANFTFVICGETGVGKSTLASMLVKFLEEAQDISINTRSLSFAQSFHASKRIRVHKDGSPQGWLVDPTRRHGEYLPEEYQGNMRLITKNLKEARRSLKRSAIVLEQIGIVPDWLGTGYDYGLGLMRQLVEYDHTYFFGIVTDPKVEARSAAFRTALENLHQSGQFTPEKFEELAKRYKLRTDEPIDDNNFTNFMMNIAGRVGIERVHDLVNDGLLDLMTKKGVDLIKGFVPEDKKDLLTKFKRYPHTRTEALDGYINYLFKDMGLNPNRYLVGQNHFIPHKEIDLYRKVTRDAALPLNPKLLNGKLYTYDYALSAATL